MSNTPLKTKEEILNDIIEQDEAKMHLAKSQVYQSHNGINYCMVRVDLVTAAMSEYASQVQGGAKKESQNKKVAVQFAKWIASGECMYLPGDGPDEWNEISHEGIHTKRITTDQLYEIYKQKI